MKERDLAVCRDGSRPMIGDKVQLEATVLESLAGVGVLLEVFSKTDQMKVWVRESHLLSTVSDEGLPVEPLNGTLLLLTLTDGRGMAFRRDDEEGHFDPGRRHDRHWFSISDQMWVDWRHVAAALVRLDVKHEERFSPVRTSGASHGDPEANA